eukprot:scaffold1129_cov376-Prasinococcus_capsulatus_cf.AAC.3
MANDYAELGPLQEIGTILAAKKDWDSLYSAVKLTDTPVPCAALVSYEDIFVEREFSEATAKILGRNCKVWITNEFQHSGLRDDPSVFDKLMNMTKDVVQIPS